MNYNPYLKNLLKNFYLLQVQRYRKQLHQTEEVIKKIKEFEEKIQDVTESRDKDAIEKVNENYI